MGLHLIMCFSRIWMSFPLESELRIQDLSIKVNSFQLNGIFARLNNARLRMPVSEPVIVNAELWTMVDWKGRFLVLLLM